MKRSDRDVDMTPMVDVTFLLFIFFMVTAAFTLQKSFRIPTPTSTGGSERPSDQEKIIVHVDRFNTFRVITDEWEAEAPSEHELNIKLQQARNESDEQPLTMLVRANGDALHEKVVAAIDAGSHVGINEIRLQRIEED